MVLIVKAIAGLLWSALSFNSAIASDFYALNPGDELNIHVWNEDALQRSVFILPDGSISFPLVGRIKAGGRSADGLEKEITEKLSEYLSDPVVNVTVTSVEGNVVYIVGQVNQPGPIVMHQSMSVMQALANAGGLTAYASENGIRLIRKAIKGGREEVLKVRYADLKDGDNLSTNHTLLAGDVIVVP